jgi:hypothetical protein
MLDNTVAVLRSHAAGSQRVPGGLGVALYPFLDIGNIL